VTGANPALAAGAFNGRTPDCPVATDDIDAVAGVLPEGRAPGKLRPTVAVAGAGVGDKPDIESDASG
jgi:hypothetical protein